MKKLKSLFVILFVGLAISCGNDDDNPNEMDANIIGTWKLTSDIEDGIEYVEEGECDFFWVFTENTFNVIEYGGNDCTTLYDSEILSYTIEDNMIKGPFDNDPEGIIYNEILELTETTLKIEESDGEGYVAYTVWERQ